LPHSIWVVQVPQSPTSLVFLQSVVYQISLKLFMPLYIGLSFLLNDKIRLFLASGSLRVHLTQLLISWSLLMLIFTIQIWSFENNILLCGLVGSDIWKESTLSHRKLLWEKSWVRPPLLLLQFIKAVVFAVDNL
jgi:hypothetical protein